MPITSLSFLEFLGLSSSSFLSTSYLISVSASIVQWMIFFSISPIINPHFQETWILLNYLSMEHSGDPRPYKPFQRKARVDWTDETKKIACRMREHGHDLYHISKMLDMCEPAVKHFFEEVDDLGGIPDGRKRGRKCLPSVVTDSILYLADSLENPTGQKIFEEIHIQLPVSRSSVYQTLWRNAYASQVIDHVFFLYTQQLTCFSVSRNKKH